MTSTRSLAALLSAIALLPALAGCLDPETTVSEDLAGLAPGQLREFEFGVLEDAYDPGNGRTFFGMGFTGPDDGRVTLPGPEIRVTEGDTVRLTLRDGLHTVHWHGVSVPWTMDGVPYMTQTIAEGTYAYEFVAHETGTFWYHCHVDAPVHVDRGMFGAFIVEPRDRSVDPPFDREATLFFHEIDSVQWSLVDAVLMGNPDYLHPPGNPAELPGHAQHAAAGAVDVTNLILRSNGVDDGGEGAAREHYPRPSLRYTPKYDTFMINGKVFPHTEPVHIKTGETLRLRLINAGQLPHGFHIHGHRALVTHIDGSLLAAPYRADTIPLFPGQRVDVYITGNNPGIWDMHDHGGGWGAGAYAANQGVFPGGMNTMLVYEDFPLADLPGPKAGRTSGDYRAFLSGHHRAHAAPAGGTFAPPVVAEAESKADAPASPPTHRAPGAPSATAPPSSPASGLLERLEQALPRSPLAGTLTFWGAVIA